LIYWMLFGVISPTRAETSINASRNDLCVHSLKATVARNAFSDDVDIIAKLQPKLIVRISLWKIVRHLT